MVQELVGILKLGSVRAAGSSVCAEGWFMIIRWRSNGLSYERV